MKKRNTKKTNIPNGLTEAIAAIVIFFVIIFVIILARVSPLPENNNRSETTATVAAAETNTLQLLAPDVTLPLALADGISLTELVAADALFPEDGSNTPGENLLCAVVRNDSKQTLEYMTFTLTCGEEAYEFSVTTLPPSTEVYVFEKNAAAAPEQIMELTADVPIQLFFDEEPELMEEELEITVRDGTIDIKNISDTPIDREIQVYYKNTENLAYFGGITYFLRVPAGLAPGEVYNGYAANASMARTEVMFVKYGK